MQPIFPLAVHDEKAKSEIRHNLLQNIAIGLAKDAESEELLHQSQNWPGYQAAFDSWSKAMWQWIDSKLTPEVEREWRAKLISLRAGFSRSSDFSEPANKKDIENYLQRYLLERSYFLEGLRFKKAIDPKWFKGFGSFFDVAQRIDDDAPFEALAQLTKRKASQDAGKRSLRFWLLVLWMPGCFWALTNNGISDRLIWRKSDFRYSEGTIKNMISTIGLWRPMKPLFWGVDSNRQLVSLR